ncbi:Acg family FMN-binding oxidoreductase [Saccharopolyspora griseoalba]|uniref:Acg family FMN-binding oxidoreductase n=1 Tax=Saccharopolyspora griseoalba TaxID=1431848 RepID=A0ABW2LP60_9PSEU
MVFPSTMGLPPERAEEVVRLAGMAPSLHNRQPWRFRLLAHLIELHFAPSARLPVADPHDRELRLGCGAALLNLRIALEHAGVRPIATLLPRLHGQTALAEVRAGSGEPPAPDERRLHRAISERRSNRRPFLPDPVPERDRHALAHAVHEEGCRLHVVEREQLSALEELVHRAHRAQTSDPKFRSELARWTGRAEGEAEGVPVSAAGPQPEPHDLWVLRDFSAGQARQRVPGKDFETDPLMVVVCSYHPGRLADLQAGQALQRMLLTATSLGLVASLISQVVEVDETREELRRLLGGRLQPQALLRLGYGSPAPATPRLQPAELLVDDETAAESGP